MGARLRVLVSAGAAEGHAFPALALSRALAERGHEPLVELAERWREPVGALGARFSPASEYIAFPGVAPPTASGPTLIDAARSLVRVIEEFRPHVVVGDLGAPAPALAAELAGVRSATLIPTVYPIQGAGLPLFPIGFVAPRTPLGSWMWRAVEPALRGLRPTTQWLRRVPDLLNGSRAELGLAPLRSDTPITTYGAISDGLVLVATFPELEYPRAWPAGVHVTGPMRFELPYPEIELPAGEEPLILIASSTAQDLAHDLVRDAIGALEGEPVRVAATLNRRREAWSGRVPPNAIVADWFSYRQLMPKAALVITTGGLGTVARALADGVPVLVCPVGADTAENGARVTWAGAGLMLPPRLLAASTLRRAVRRLLADPRFARRAREIGARGRREDGAARGAELVERYASGATGPAPR
jgi:UDP:flavonoid glycosyltransferase YjiC (YdhE family)